MPVIWKAFLYHDISMISHLLLQYLIYVWLKHNQTVKINPVGMQPFRLVVVPFEVCPYSYSVLSTDGWLLHHWHLSLQKAGDNREQVIDVNSLLGTTKMASGLKVIKVQFVIMDNSCVTYITVQIGQTKLTGVYPNYTMFSAPWFQAVPGQS